MPKRKLIVAYIVLVGLPILGLLSVLDAGRGLTAPPAAAVLGKATSSTTVSALTLPLLILQIGVIIILARLAGVLFKKINQPQVIGEMAVGILLGPSLLGWVAPGVSATVFPLGSLDYLNAFSQIGLVLFMFLVGLAMNTQDLNEYGPPAVFTSHVSIVVPVLSGQRDGAVFVSPARRSLRELYGFRAFHGGRPEYFRVSGAGAHPDGAESDSHPPGYAGDRLRSRG